MGITVLGRKLQIDGNRAAADYAAYEDPAAYHKGGDVWHFVDLKDVAGLLYDRRESSHAGLFENVYICKK